MGLNLRPVFSKHLFLIASPLLRTREVLRFTLHAIHVSLLLPSILSLELYLDAHYVQQALEPQRRWVWTSAAGMQVSPRLPCGFTTWMVSGQADPEESKCH